MSLHFLRGENLGEFRIRGLQIGLYLRNISNENLGVDRHVSKPSKSKENKVETYFASIARILFEFILLH